MTEPGPTRPVTYGQPPFSDGGPQPATDPAVGGVSDPSWSPSTASTTPASYPGASATGPAVPRSNALGLLGLGLVVVGAVVAIPSLLVLAESAAAYALEHGLGEANSSINDPKVQAWMATVPGWVLAVQGACVAGLLGWIVSVIAVVKRSGRAFGWIGILLGLATPFLAGLLGFWALSNAINA